MRQWRYKVDISDIMGCGDETFQETRDALVARLSGSEWYRGNDSLADLVDELRLTTDPGGFDFVFDDIYDLADAQGAWLDPWGSAK
jgi:hypothetical protein